LPQKCQFDAAPGGRLGDQFAGHSKADTCARGTGTERDLISGPPHRQIDAARVAIASDAR
jgi:hypothetical protein